MHSCVRIYRDTNPLDHQLAPSIRFALHESLGLRSNSSWSLFHQKMELDRRLANRGTIITLPSLGCERSKPSAVGFPFLSACNKENEWPFLFPPRSTTLPLCLHRFYLNRRRIRGSKNTQPDHPVREYHLARPPFSLCVRKPVDLESHRPSIAE